MRSRMFTALAPDEQVIYVAAPNTQSYWMSIGCGAIIGFFFFLLPGLIILVVGMIQYAKFRDAECIITTRRVIVSGWGSGRRMVEFEHQEIAGVTRSGSLTKTVTIRGTDGRGVRLRNVAYDWELVEKIQEAMAASQSGTP
ncbi:MAG: hypothetical protein OXU28_05240 [Chloroflexota bacterium]|nr:hypothetical protein [Chloroflexota bacterium]